MNKWVIATDILPNTDGVIGLNGIDYLRDENYEVIEFETEQDAITFASEKDIDLDDESIWVQERVIKTS